jgi:hypothetical protein
MTIDEKIMTVGKLRGGMCAVAAGITLRRHFILKRNFPLTLNSMLNFPVTFYCVTVCLINIITLHFIFFLLALHFHGLISVSLFIGFI